MYLVRYRWYIIRDDEYTICVFCMTDQVVCVYIYSI